MIKCKDCHVFSQECEIGGICGLSNFGTVKLDDGCRTGDIINTVYEIGIERFAKKLKSELTGWETELTDEEIEYTIDDVAEQLKK
jgi:hypothetical protein